ncbi:MAG: hypothetical protein R3F65_29040 [bacterium]
MDGRGMMDDPRGAARRAQRPAWLGALLGAALALSACDPAEEPPPPAAPGWFDHPQALAFAGDRLVVANSGYRPDGWAPGSLSIIDPASGALLHRVATAHHNPQALVVHEGALYVVATGALDLGDFDRPRVGSAGAVEVFPLDTLTTATGPARVFALPAHPDDDRIGGPVDLAIGDGLAVVGSALANVVWTLDLRRGDWSRGPADPVRLAPEYALGLGAVRAWAGGFALVDFNTDTLHLLDAAGLPVGCAVDVGTVPGELEGAGSPVVDGATLYVVLSHAGRIRAVDLLDLKDDCDAPVRTVVEGIGAVPNDLRLHAGRLFVVSSGEGTVAAYETDGRAAGRWVLPAGSNPWHVAFEGAQMAVSEWAAHAVTLVDLETGATRRLAGVALPPVEAPPVDEAGGGAPALADTVLAAPDGDGAGAVDGVRGGGERAGSTDTAALGLEPGAALVLAWSGRRVVDGPGADLVVFENAFRYAGGVFMDPVVVELSVDGESWVAWPHAYLGPADAYVPDPAAWPGFAGLSPVGLHAEHNPVDPFSAAAGGDRFDLAALPDDGALGQIRREGFVAVRLSSAAAHLDPATGAPYPRDRVSDGADIDGIAARYFLPLDPDAAP